MITIEHEAQSLLRMHVRGIPAHTLRQLLESSRHGPWTQAEIICVMARLRARGWAEVRTDGRWHMTTAAIEEDDAALEAAMRPEPSFAVRSFGVSFWKLWLAAALLLGSVVGCVCMAEAGEARWVTVEATAYCPCALCCDVRTEKTADGTSTNAEPYGVAASPDLPIGTVVTIPVGLGYLDQTYPRDSQRMFRVDDRGGALRTDWKRYGITRLDLRYRSHDYAVRFGRRLIRVEIVLP